MQINYIFIINNDLINCAFPIYPLSKFHERIDNPYPFNQYVPNNLL